MRETASERRPYTATGEGIEPGATDNITRGVVIVPEFRSTQNQHRDRRYRDGSDTRSPQARLAEAEGLVRAIDVDIAHSEIVSYSRPRPATLIGTGKLKQLAEIVEHTRTEVVFVDHPLTPVQQRNLERALDAKVLDRTGLILEIFGRRARTREGVLQVELAHLEYQRGRLVRSWTHLERQRGGAGFLGGPGETQIEADRRMLQERIVRLKRELQNVRRTRELHRANRRRVPYPVVAIVGYTNAGKSTLFNRLTGASVEARDMLFATLDPTLRQLRLPNGTSVILSDTVGFISDLPTHLVAAFRATLEEVVEADLILHVRDMSDPDGTAQSVDVRRILKDLGIEPDDSRVLEVWNKCDLAGADFACSDDRSELGGSLSNRVIVSAKTGQGIDKLLSEIEKRITGGLQTFTVKLKPEQASWIDWLYRNCTVLKRQDRNDGSIEIVARGSAAAKATVEAQTGEKLTKQN